MDMNDRSLRSIVVGLGGLNGGPTREDRFVIVPGSEIMAILCLAADIVDLEQRLSRIIVGLTRDRKPVTAGDLKASGAMALLLRDIVGLSYTEIADSLEITLATVKWRIFKAREEVQLALAREGITFGEDEREAAVPAVVS